MLKLAPFHMEIPDFVLAATVTYLARRFTQISFSIPYAFDAEPRDEPENHSAVTSSEDSTDSASQAFLFADYVVGCLIRLRANGLDRDPTMRLNLVRHSSRGYFTGYTLCLTRISTLAAASSSWLRIVLTELSDKWRLRMHYLEQVSRANRLPCKILRCTEDEYVARFTGRVCRSLQWGRVISPLHSV